MQKGKKTAASKATIPPEHVQSIQRALSAMRNPSLNAGIRGRFVYVTHDDEPLCRLGYRGSDDEWDYAIYKYSKGAYSSDELFMPSSGPIEQCVRIAVDAYNLA